MSILAAVLAAAAVATAMGAPAATGLRRLAPRPGPRQRHMRRAPLLLVGLGLVWVGVLLGWRVLGWVVSAGIVVATIAWLALQSARAKRAAAAEEETARAAQTVALLLRAGQIPTAALTEAAVDSPCLAPAAAAVRLGGDAGEALIAAAGEPGRDGLAQLGAAWRVSEASGAPVADVVAQVSECMRRERLVGDVVTSELSAARTSGRIMATLPFVAIALGTSVGADPIPFLFGEPLGQVLLVAGLGLAAGGVVWTDRIAAGPMRRGGS